MNTIAFLMASLAIGQADDTAEVRARIAITVAIQQLKQTDYIGPPKTDYVAPPLTPRLVAPQEEVRQAPRPFSAGKSLSVKQTADADQDAASSWQWSDDDVPEYMERYTPAKYTQSIFKNQYGSRIDRVPRTRQEEKWRVPGGLAGIDGWVSELWSWAPRQVTLDYIPVKNSFGYFQRELGYKAKYEPGTEFLDVLKNRDTGEVFEVRKAMKTDRGWQRFVTYRRAEHRPPGYHGPKGLDCHSCHSESGSGAYAAGLIPGGDSVLSMPFPALEVK